MIWVGLKLWGLDGLEVKIRKAFLIPYQLETFIIIACVSSKRPLVNH